MFYFLLGFGIGSVLIFGVAMICIGGDVGDGITREEEQQKAVKAGVGGWVINADTGESQFVYANALDLEEFDPNKEMTDEQEEFKTQ